MKFRPSQSGFSLVELSIVLVILGLLTGGILAGQSLIRAAELRAAVTESMRYKTAVQSFRDKYFAIPGDMSNATSFWGTAGGNGANAACQTAATSASAGTCNGDGNGQNLVSSGGIAEYFFTWQHLANAGLIEGSYSGNLVAWSPGVNVPVSKVGPTVFWYTAYVGVLAASPNLFAGDFGNILRLQPVNWSWATANSAALTPSEAWNVDTKLDDGLPGTGSVIAYKGNSTNSICTSVAGSATDAGATYVLSSNVKDCTIFMSRAY